MKKGKRWIALGAVLALCMSLCACSSSEGVGSESVAGDEEVGEVWEESSEMIPLYEEYDGELPVGWKDGVKISGEFPAIKEEVQGEQLAFEVQYVRTDGYLDGEEYPKVFVIHTKEDLDAYAETSERFLEAVQAYDEEWFEDHQLVLVVLEESSGSVRHEVKSVVKTQEGEGVIEVIRRRPDVGTTDMAKWHLVLEMAKESFANGDQIRVEFVEGE